MSGAPSSTATLIGVSSRREFFPELESLRGIAVLLVFLVHVDENVHRALTPWPGWVPLPWAFVRHGRTGVDIFFVLSGFLLSLPFVADLRAGRRVEVRPYLVRRALRILPLYWTAVVVGTMLTSTRPADLLRGVPFLFFLNSFGRFIVPMAPYNLVWWSVATEVQFYVALALFVILLQSTAGRWLSALLLVLWAAAYGVYVCRPARFATSDEIALQYSLFCRAPLFLAGVGAALVYDRWGARVRRWAVRTAWVRNGGADVAMLLVLWAIGAFLQWMLVFGSETYLPAYQVSDVPKSVAFATVLLILVLAPLRTKVLFSNPVLARSGSSRTRCSSSTTRSSCSDCARSGGSSPSRSAG